MNEDTPRFALPLIEPGQAQKELFHNEALARIDAALHASIEGSAAQPPAAPARGQAWRVESGASGAFAGHESEIAFWTEGGWRFLAPAEGMSVWNRGAGVPETYSDGGWSGGELACSAVRVGGVQVVGERQPAVPSPSGGTTIDAEARAAIAALTAALMSHGLIA
jgi:hypothetical protein